MAVVVVVVVVVRVPLQGHQEQMHRIQAQGSTLVWVQVHLPLVHQVHRGMHLGMHWGMRHPRPRRGQY